MARINIRAGAAQSHQIGNALRHDHEERQGALNVVDVGQLHRLDLAGIF